MNCLRPIDLERFAIGEGALGPTPGTAVGDHVRGCARCAARVATLQSEREAFLRTHPKERLLARLDLERSRPGAREAAWTRWFRGAAALAVVSAALVAVLPAWLGERAAEQAQVRFKGAPLAVFYKRGDLAPQPVTDQVRLMAGDALRLRYLAPTAGQLLVVAVTGGSGEMSVLFPSGARESAAVPAGETWLPGSAIVDADPRTEEVIAIFRREPFTLSDVEAALRLPAKQDGSDGPPCGGCTSFRVTLQKHP